METFLVEKNLPLYVWIGEDATHIMGKIEFNVISNKLFGFVIPLVNRCPKTDTFLATLAQEIINHFETSIKLDYAYLYNNGTAIITISSIILCINFWIGQ